MRFKWVTVLFSPRSPAGLLEFAQGSVKMHKQRSEAAAADAIRRAVKLLAHGSLAVAQMLRLCVILTLWLLQGFLRRVTKCRLPPHATFWVRCLCL